MRVIAAPTRPHHLCDSKVTAAIAGAAAMPTLFIALLVSSFISASASAATTAILIGPDLKPQEVKLQALGGGKISYFDDERRLQVASTATVLQIRFVAAPAPAPGAEAASDSGDKPTTPAVVPKPNDVAPRGEGLPPKPAEPANSKADPPAQPKLVFVELSDGQRLVARWIGADDAGQKFAFEHPALGAVTVNLDKVTRLALDGAATAAATPAKDQVVLVNGDALEGFVASVKKDNIELQAAGGKPLTLPTDRVKTLLLANPVTPPREPKPVVWLRDGSRLIAAQAEIEADKLLLRAGLTGDRQIVLPLAQVARLELPSSQGRLIDLTELRLTVKDGGKVFGLAVPPRVQDGVLRLHAPVTIEFALPPGAARLAALVELDADGEDAQWADFIVSFRAGDSAQRLPIGADRQRAEVLLDLLGPTLTISLDPAANGPVMDRLRLREAIMFVKTP